MRWVYDAVAAWLDDTIMLLTNVSKTGCSGRAAERADMLLRDLEKLAPALTSPPIYEPSTVSNNAKLPDDIQVAICDLRTEAEAAICDITRSQLFEAADRLKRARQNWTDRLSQE